MRFLSPLSRLWRRASDALDSGNTQEVLLLGLMPDNFAWNSDLARLGNATRLYESFSLASLLEMAKPRALVTVVGLGTRRGLLCPTQEGSSVLPGSWCQADDHEVDLFAFSCHSADYLVSTGSLANIRGAICYEGEIWLSLDHRGFWVDLLASLRRALKGEGRISPASFARIQSRYSKEINRRGTKQEDYFRQICLVRQSESVRFKNGGRD